MRKSISICFVLLITFCVSVPVLGNDLLNQEVPDAAKSLLDTDRDFAKTSESKGAAEAFSMYLAEDAMQLPGGSQPIYGRKAIVQALGSGYVLKWDPKKAEVAKSGELGWTWGTFEVHSTDPQGKPVVQYGKYVNVWRKQKDGSWKVIVDLGNPSPPPGRQ
jgi:ketosteroid isomerase-like protein